MKKRQCCLFVGLAMAIIFMNTSFVNAAANIKFKKTPAIKSKVPGTKVNLPDLVVKKAAWSKNPKEGDIVGASPILNITIWNKGTAAAGASKLGIACKSLTGTNYPYPLSGQINIQPLAPGKSMTYAWPPTSSEKWFSGTYQLDFTADYHFNMVKESNETNNKRTLTFAVASKMKKLKKIGIQNKIQAKPKNQFKLINTDLEVVSIAMTPTNPVAGEIVTFVAIIKNSGKTKTPQVDSIFTFWDTKGGAGSGGLFSTGSPSVPPLFTGQTFELKTTTQFITLGDSAGVLVKIDRFNKFKEDNEKNNEKKLFFSVQCKPELNLYDYTKAKPASIKADAQPGEQFSLTVWIYNNAWCDSKASKLSIEGDELPLNMYHVPPIGPRQRIGIPVSLQWAQSGYKHCKIKVDATNINIESIENNNEMELIVHVFPTPGAWPVPE